MNTHSLRHALPWLALALLACASEAVNTHLQHQRSAAAQEATRQPEEETAINIHYLEIVTPDVDATCDTLGKVHAVTFGEPVPELGNARTATLDGGGRIGVRAPMRDTEEPVVRSYLLVDDIDAAAERAEAAGAQFAMPPTEIPGKGRFAIYFLGGIQHGLWQR